jgi:hypothetical protein
MKKKGLLKDIDAPGPDNLNRGRSSRLICRRDELLIIRYYYHTEIKRLRFDDVLKTLSEDEFFIEKSTILNRLGKHSRKLEDMYTGKPSLAKLKELCGRFIVDPTREERERYEKTCN